MPHNRLKVRIGIPGVCLLLLFALNLSGQGLSNHNWFFGNSQNAILFDRGNNQPAINNNQFTPFGNAGSAVGTDPVTGNLIFYTDGANVYDIYHDLMPNGGGLSGNTAAAQPVAVTAVPGQQGHNYIFTNSGAVGAGGSVAHSILERNLLGNAAFPEPATGDIGAVKEVALPDLNNTSPGMLAIANEDRDGFWLITHIHGTNDYQVTEIDGTGTFTTTVFDDLGFDLVANHLSYHPGSNKIAVAPTTANRNVLILDIDLSTGALTQDRILLNTGFDDGTDPSVSATEWAPSGNFLYISRKGNGGNGNLFQVDLSEPDSDPQTLLSPAPEESYGLKLAPDGNIYHLFLSGGAFNLGRINEPDSLPGLIDYELNPFGTLNFQGRHFPAFLPPIDPMLSVSFTFEGACANNPVVFFSEIVPPPDSVRWDFGLNGETSNALNPIFTYDQPGTYNVTLNAFLDGSMESFSAPVTINPFEFQFTIPSDTTLCPDEFPFTITAEGSGSGTPQFQWSNQPGPGATTTIDSAGFYYVVATIGGCSAHHGLNVVEFGSMEQRANIWYFGQNAGIDFNPFPDDPIIALDNSAMNAPAGAAAISDRNGQIIFYTNGNEVFDRNHNMIEDGIGGDPNSSQSAIIVPFPGDETLYYIFTTQEIYGTYQFALKYSVFDLKENGGFGAVIEKDVLLFSGSTERITGNDGWVIIHEYGNNAFRAFPITGGGIGVPVISNSGSVHRQNIPENGKGYMKLGPQNRLAVTLSSPGTSNLVEIFDFEDSTGRINNFRQIDLEEPSGQVYGVEFSAGGNKLFASITGSPSALYEYAFDSLGIPYQKQVLDNQPFEIGAIQIGPDGQIYVAMNTQNFLGTIQVAEDTAQVSTFLPSGFALAPGTSSGLGLPNFIQNISNPVGGPSISVVGSCVGVEISFNGTGLSDIDEFEWQFGDGNGATGESATHVYGSAGTYNVTLRITNRCGLDTLINETVVIGDNPANPTIPPVVSLCEDEIVLEAAPAGAPNLADLSFVWSTGDSTRTISVSQQTIVSVTITNSFGCTSSGETTVIDNRPTIDLGPDALVCQNDNFPNLDASNTGANFQWTINGTNASTNRFQSVDTSTPGDFIYEVTVLDPITTCEATESKLITIQPEPSISVLGINSPGCGNDDGAITLEIFGQGSYAYTVAGPQPFGNGNITAPSGPISEGNLPVGTYLVRVTNEVSGCENDQSVVIEDDASTLDITATGQPGCDLLDVAVSVAGSGFPTANFILTNINTGNTIQGTGVTLPNFTVTGVPPGTYTILVDDSGCTEVSDNFDVEESDPARIDVTVDECLDPVTATASSPDISAGNSAFLWSGPGGFSSINGTINPTASGSYAVTISDNSGAFCNADTTLTINVRPPVVPEINLVGDPCDGQVVLAASPSGGNYSYQWRLNNNVVPGGQQIAVNASNDGIYTVRVRDQITGCEELSDPFEVRVNEQISLSLQATQACETQPFTITATANPPGVNISWSFDGQDIFGSSGSNTHEDVRGGVYTVSAELEGCVTVRTINIVPLPLTLGQLPNREVICDDPDNADPETSQVDLDPGDGFVSYEWRVQGTTLTISTDRIFTATEAAIYEVELTNSFGCTDIDVVEVINDCIPVINGPNAFRPSSGIGTNTEFFLISFFISDFEIFIFNRWGELIFYSDDRDFRWNGGINNNPDNIVPVGTYAYRVRYRSVYRPDQGELEQKGSITVIR